MAALQGLSGLYPDPPDTGQTMDQGVLEARASVNPNVAEHGQYGSQSVGYQGTVPSESPYSNLAVYDGWTYEDAAQYGGRDFNVAGQEIDVTPTTHSSPSPRIGQSSFMSWDNPDGVAAIGEQMSEMHGPDYGGVGIHSHRNQAGHEEITHYTTERYDAPNENYLAPDVPGQLKISTGVGTGASGHGNADPTQGYGVLNTLPEFQMGHSIRREQHDHMPWDYTNTHGEQDVPFYGRHPIQQMPLNGPDSPYFEQGDIDGANIPWEGRIGDPSAYVQPSEVTIGPAPAPADYYPALAF
jgi:hypothetical protein